MIGTWQLLIIVLVVVLLFGGAKIPELMRGMGRGVKEFKDAMNTDYSAEEKPRKESPAARQDDPAESNNGRKTGGKPAGKSGRRASKKSADTSTDKQ